MTETLWAHFANQGPVVGILAIAIWWLNRGNREIIAELNKERSERITALEKRADDQEKHTQECNEDRNKIRDMFIEHLTTP